MSAWYDDEAETPDLESEVHQIPRRMFFRLLVVVLVTTEIMTVCSMIMIEAMIHNRINQELVLIACGMTAFVCLTYLAYLRSK